MATTKEKIKEEVPQSSRLYRSETNKILAGVAGGLGEYFDVDPTIIRIIFLLLTIFGGSGILIYIILWIIIPTQSKLAEESGATIHTNVEEMKTKAQTFAHDLRASRSKTESRHWWALTIVILGFIFLMENFGLLGSLDLEKLWPVILIVFGLLILTRK